MLWSCSEDEPKPSPQDADQTDQQDADQTELEVADEHELELPDGVELDEADEQQTCRPDGPYDYLTDLPIEHPWSASAQDYRPGSSLFVRRLIYPPMLKNPLGIDDEMSCCRDWGESSRDRISDCSVGLDNAAVQLASFGEMFSISMQDYADLYMRNGDLVWVLDRVTPSGVEPEQMLLASLLASYAEGTDAEKAARGEGQMMARGASFRGSTGEPQHVTLASAPSEQGFETVVAPFVLPISVFSTLLWVPAHDVQVEAKATEVEGVRVFTGSISGFVLVDDLMRAVNEMIQSARCDCLGAQRPLWSKVDGKWRVANCLERDESKLLCATGDEAVCSTLGGGLPFFESTCDFLPGLYQSSADLDLDGSCKVEERCDYEAFSVGYLFEAVDVQVLVD